MSLRATVIWAALVAALVVPLAIAAASPLLEWRGPVYIAAGFAGIVGLGLMLLQPLLAAGHLPGVSLRDGRQVHRWIGLALVAAVVVHVGGLWITSPPDVIDALTYTSPTRFSGWGVSAMWAIFGAAALAGLRWRLRIRPRPWRLGHSSLVTVAVLCTVLHAVLIDGAMGTVSKWALCALVVAATIWALHDLRTLALLRRLSSRGRGG